MMLHVAHCNKIILTSGEIEEINWNMVHGCMLTANACWRVLSNQLFSSSSSSSEVMSFENILSVSSALSIKLMVSDIYATMPTSESAIFSFNLPERMEMIKNNLFPDVESSMNSIAQKFRINKKFFRRASHKTSKDKSYPFSGSNIIMHEWTIIGVQEITQFVILRIEQFRCSPAMFSLFPCEFWQFN